MSVQHCKKQKIKKLAKSIEWNAYLSIAGLKIHLNIAYMSQGVIKIFLQLDLIK